VPHLQQSYLVQPRDPDCRWAHASYMPPTCAIHASYMPLYMPPYMPHTCLIHAMYLPQTCLIHAPYMPHTCLIHASCKPPYMPHTCLIQAFIHAFIHTSQAFIHAFMHASYLPHTCLIHAFVHTSATIAFAVMPQRLSAHALVLESGLATNWADELQNSPNLSCFMSVHRL